MTRCPLPWANPNPCLLARSERRGNGAAETERGPVPRAGRARRRVLWAVRDPVGAVERDPRRRSVGAVDVDHGRPAHSNVPVLPGPDGDELLPAREIRDGEPAE